MANNPYLPFRAPILSKTRQTAADWTYRLGCSLHPAPGQFVEVSLPGVGECPISISDFTSDSVELTIRRVGKVTDSLSRQEETDYLYLRGPYGHGFPLEQFAGRHLIIAAGGTGLAPVKSVIRHFAEKPGALAELTVLAGFKSPEDILFRPELENWGRSFNVQVTVDQVPCASDPNPAGTEEYPQGNGEYPGGQAHLTGLNPAGRPWPGHVGLITALIPDLTIPSPANAVAIVVGPPAMMKFTCAELLRRGLKEEQVWVSLERRMSCGLGKCGHCRVGSTHVCLDGPVFNYAKARKLVD
ncbi:Cytochrome-c3 hydrogenase, gamma subunit [Acididesulfobacillus acetoxydans]|uniref:Cytochrome-c3 hydrogenase, gamma subunit n=1 Tax=Acididesulfobacillus acetoxydans TaxID=1561005 RepID=A0A8S0VYM7_9FIRM|nr:anaerobic sulfite reductase subunit AsrB [Acididesulfobacillus acetoxydans]CAA7603203.1 Cytochrome-c3 hydrogenase, gamma subunit [Acididesulfobacillus acetoxydans]